MKQRWSSVGALLLFAGMAPVGAFAQTGTLRGKVTNQVSGAAIAGATVSFGSRITQTREDGQYVLSGVTAGTDSVRARLIGYGPAARQVRVAAGQTVEADLTMTASAVSLAEIVVTGYGEQRAGNITGAVTQVTAADFNTGRIVSPEELIRSKVPGVQVVDNNEPGGGLSIRIRGPTSINASSEPLYVIDGVPIGNGAGGGLTVAGRNPLNFLNPNDIASITVLRDASAAAIYGANAANGVILIQTKGGQAGTTVVEYTGSMSASSVTRLPNMLNADQFRAAVTEFAPGSVGQLQSANTNWMDLITRTGYGQEHNLGISGASEKLNWRLSGGFLDQDGIIRGTTTQRVSLGLNFQQRLLDDRLDLRANIRGSRTKDFFTPGGVLSNAAQFGPTQPVLDGNTPTGYYDWPGNTLQSADNPIALLELATDVGTTYRSLGGVQGQYRLLEALKANVHLSYDVVRTDRQTFFPRVLHGQTKTGNLGSDYRANQSQSNTTFETFLNYGAVRAGPGDVDVTGGYSYAWSHAEYPWYQATGLSTDLLQGNGVTSAVTTQNFQDIQESRLISFFGRVNYNINDKYLFSASVRRDGSSRFGPTHEWGLFPSASLGWRLSEESFMRGGTFSDLKLRVSAARTGNQAFGNYLQYSQYVLGDAQTQVQFGNQFIPTIRPSAVDPNIQWEKTHAYNLGVDFGIMNQKVTGSLDFYIKTTRDLIFTVPVAAGTNLSNFVTTNIGRMKNKGFELSLSARMIEGRSNGLTWTTDFTASHNTNSLTSINPFAGSAQRILVGNVAGGVGTLIQTLEPGVPVNSFYVYEHILEDGKPIYKDRQGLTNGVFNNTPDGSINEHDLYVDRNGDNKINQDDRRPFHDPAPKWMLGHTSYIGLKKFDLSFTLRSYLGSYVYNNVASNLGTYSEVTRASPYNLHASVLETEFRTPQYLSDYYVEDASFLRMDNVTLAYTFGYRGQPVRIFGTLQNAFTITGYSGVDPTAGLLGIDNNIYPRSRTFTAGLNLRF